MVRHVGLHARAHLNEDPLLADAIGLDDVQPPHIDFLIHQALHGGCHMLNCLILHAHMLRCCRPTLKAHAGQ